MPKFVTVTPNPAIDRTYILQNLATGEVNRARNVSISAGGKGINVARALRTLGSNVVSTGFIGGFCGKQLLSLLLDEGLKQKFFDVSPIETRSSIICIDESTGEQTVVNELGPTLNDKYLDHLELVLTGIGTDTDGIVFSGSLPVGITPKRYRKLIESVKPLTKLTLLDATGEMLKECIKASPSILKINRNEAMSLGVNIKDWDTGAVAAAQHLLDKYKLKYVSITDGGDGAVLISENRNASAHMPTLEVISAVGSGDSFAAGLIHALASIPDDIPGALRLAAACGAANAQTNSPAVFTSEQIAALSGRIKLG